ncbi:MAG: T9SS type A sorting domain-containing protein [Bacteroidetes bacterium]|nr:T9SS type A sorting domain-containing protein [Bacteroidota bacterium]
MTKFRLLIIFLSCISASSGQQVQSPVKFPVDDINNSLNQLSQQPLTSLKKENNSFDPASVKSPFQLLKKMKELQNHPFRKGVLQNTIQQIDTVLVGDVPNDTLVITGSYTHNGPVFVFNDGVLIVHNANVTNVGDVYVFGSGRILADSSSLFFPQQYFYERSLVVVQNSYVHMEACSLSYGGFSHNLLVADSAIFDVQQCYFNDWTTAGLYGHPLVNLHGVNLGGEYILTDHATATFNHVNTLILWHHFPDSSVINFSFPNGANVSNYVFNNSIPGISGIGYDVHADTCTGVGWGLMPVNGSDVTISNSSIRAVGAWFQHGDTVSVSGLVDNSNYTNFTAPLADRNLHFINSSVQTWSLYVFDTSRISISGCILGEVGCQGRSYASSSQFFLDGSGGYFWSTDTSLVIASSVSITSSVRSERNGIFVMGYSALTGGTASAIGNSVLIVVQSSLPQDPVAYDKAVAWLANIAQPASAYVNSMIPVTGSAWIDQGPLGSFMDFGSYSLYYQQQGTANWNPLVIDSTTEIRNGTLGSWNTDSLSPGNYFLKLVLSNNLGDSVEAVKSVTLLPSILSVLSNDDPNRYSLKLYPDPVSRVVTGEATFEKAERVRAVLFDAFGNEKNKCDIQVNKGTWQFGMDVSDYPDGMYFIQLFLEQEKITRRFIVHH